VGSNDVYRGHTWVVTIPVIKQYIILVLLIKYIVRFTEVLNSFAKLC